MRTELGTNFIREEYVSNINDSDSNKLMYISFERDGDTYENSGSEPYTEFLSGITSGIEKVLTLENSRKKYREDVQVGKTENIDGVGKNLTVNKIHEVLEGVIKSYQVKGDYSYIYSNDGDVDNFVFKIVEFVVFFLTSPFVYFPGPKGVLKVCFFF